MLIQGPKAAVRRGAAIRRLQILDDKGGIANGVVAMLDVWQLQHCEPM